MEIARGLRGDDVGSVAGRKRDQDWEMVSA
jgi:hypothetical protein